MYSRLSTACLILLLLALGAALSPKESVSSMAKDECYRDNTFHWTDKANQFFAENHQFTTVMVILSSGMMDFMLVICITLMNIKYDTWRVFISFAMFFFIRG